MRRALIFGLRARGVDVLTALEAEMLNRADSEHLAAAAALGRVLYSYNVADYCVLHECWAAQGRSHAGIILAAQQRYAVGDEIRRLLRLIGRIPAERMRNRIEFLSAWA